MPLTIGSIKIPQHPAEALQIMNTSFRLPGIGHQFIKRWVAQPMEANSGTASGAPSQMDGEILERQFAGGFGINWLQATAVMPEGKARPFQWVMTESNLGAFQKVVRLFQDRNPNGMLIIQLAHSGQFALEGFRVSPYPIPDRTDIKLLDDKQMETIIEKCVQSFLLAKQAGFDGADLKLCHGYLFSKMLNRQNVERPGWNFGGDTLYKRMEFIRRILGRVRQELGADDNFVLASRISTYLGLENEFGAVGGSANEDLELHDATGLVDQLLDLGVRIINISGGVPAQTPKIVRPTNENPEGVFAHFRRARALMQHINQRALVIGSGYSWLADGKKLLPKGEAEKYLGIERLEDDLFHRSLLFWAATNVLNGWTDMAGTGRQLLADPLFPQKKLDVDSGVFANWCAACGGCSEMLKGFHPHVGCVVHDEEARLFYNACRELAAREKEIQLIFLGTHAFDLVTK